MLFQKKICLATNPEVWICATSACSECLRLSGFAGEIEMPAIRGIRAIAHQLHPSLPSSLLPLTGFPELRIHPLFLLKGMRELYAGSVLSEGNFLAINAITPLY